MYKVLNVHTWSVTDILFAWSTSLPSSFAFTFLHTLMAYVLRCCKAVIRYQHINTHHTKPKGTGQEGWQRHNLFCVWGCTVLQCDNESGQTKHSNLIFDFLWTRFGCHSRYFRKRKTKLSVKSRHQHFTFPSFWIPGEESCGRLPWTCNWINNKTNVLITNDVLLELQQLYQRQWRLLYTRCLLPRFWRHWDHICRWCCIWENWWMTAPSR